MGWSYYVVLSGFRPNDDAFLASPLRYVVSHAQRRWGVSLGAEDLFAVCNDPFSYMSSLDNIVPFAQAHYVHQGSTDVLVCFRGFEKGSPMASVLCSARKAATARWTAKRLNPTTVPVFWLAGWAMKKTGEARYVVFSTDGVMQVVFKQGREVAAFRTSEEVLERMSETAKARMRKALETSRWPASLRSRDGGEGTLAGGKLERKK